MYYFIDIACVIFSLWMVHLYLSSFVQSKHKPFWLSLTLYTLFGVAITGLSFVPDASFLRLFCTFAFVGVIGVVLHGCKILQSGLLSLIFCVLVLVTDILTSLLMNALHIETTVLMQEGAPRSFYQVAAHIVLLGATLLVQFANRKSPSKMSWRIFLPVLPSWIISALLCCLLAWQVMYGNTSLSLLYIFVLLGLLYTNLIIIYCTSTMQKHAEEKTDRLLAEHHYAMQQEYYEQFRAQQEEIYALWHDISKYLRAFETEKQCGETWKQLQEMMQSISCVVDVNNRVVSVILNEYVSLAKELDVELTMDVQVPQELPITATDLYILIGNTLDNSLNAVAMLPPEHRKITLQLKLHNQILFYKVQNPFLAERKSKHRINNRYHGYGLKNVRACVSKYQGEMQTHIEDGIYTVTAHLNC